MKPLLEQMAEALLERDALLLRTLLLEWMQDKDTAAAWKKPETDDAKVFIAVAALAELFSERLEVSSPDRTMHAGSFSEPFYALKSAHRLRSVREHCEQDSPKTLRRHGIYAPANFLTVA